VCVCVCVCKCVCVCERVFVRTQHLYMAAQHVDVGQASHQTHHTHPVLAAYVHSTRMQTQVNHSYPHICEHKCFIHIHTYTSTGAIYRFYILTKTFLQVSVQVSFHKCTVQL